MPVLLTMSKDKVANIRMNVAKVAGDFGVATKGNADIEVSVENSY